MSVLQLSKTLKKKSWSFIIHWYAPKTNIHYNTFLYLQKTVPFYLQLNSIYFFPAIKKYELIRSYKFYPSAKRMSFETTLKSNSNFIIRNKDSNMVQYLIITGHSLMLSKRAGKCSILPVWWWLENETFINNSCKLISIICLYLETSSIHNC